MIAYLARLDAFIAAEITPLQAQDDNKRLFDHRREWARTDFDGGGLSRPEWATLNPHPNLPPDRGKGLQALAASASSSASTQCLTGVAVPLCKWLMQPTLAETMAVGCNSARFISLRSRNCCDKVGCSTL